ncbi:hypothetical protein [Parvicella tangerina]|uniref:Lipoprotein n=1 Tax=Parvicella tangerina TaxID=2829795 RepID=A0A916JMJ9_9FLAO|nr:hypothetical protein [Parvicella tangerina]CAG5081830.1 hypothetical protein CRYO30217_01739 [Parvicella tangerina]
MNKLFYLFIFTTLIISGCGNDQKAHSKKDNNVSSNETEPLDTTSLEEEIIAESAPSEFDMYPNVEFEDLSEIESEMYGNIKLYQGEIYNQKHTMILEQSRYSSNEYKVVLFNHESNYAYYLEGKEDSPDIINLIDYSSPGESTILLLRSDDKNTLNGTWTNDTDTVHFDFNRLISTPEERQLFIKMNGLEFANTTSELVYVGYQEPNFGHLQAHYHDGAAYDFGEEWYQDSEVLHVYDSNFVYFRTYTNNATGTNFVAGHEPTGPEDEDYIVDSEYHDGSIHLVSHFIEDGQLTSVEQDLGTYDSNVSTWMIGDLIIVLYYSYEYDSHPEFREAYQWNQNTNSFELLQTM